jgi:hypothetical protein
MKTIKRLDWKRGMEVMPSTFIASDNFQQFNHDINRKLITQKSYGLLPKVKFDIQSVIVDAILEIQEIYCEAITKNGVLIQLFEKFTIPLPSLLTGEHYIVAQIKDISHVEINEIPYLQVEYYYEVKQWAELSDGNVFPIIKIKKDGEYWEKVEYIPPCYTISSCRILLNKHEEIRKLLNEIFETIDKKKYQPYLVYGLSLHLLELNNYTNNETPYELVLLLKKIIKTLLEFEPDFDGNTDKYLQSEFEHNDVLNTLNQALLRVQNFLNFLTQQKLPIEDIIEEKDTSVIEENKDWIPEI